MGYKDSFTIQNVPIKLQILKIIQELYFYLQYKMFLLNQIDQTLNMQSCKHLQYKMFLLNRQ